MDAFPWIASMNNGTHPETFRDRLQKRLTALENLAVDVIYERRHDRNARILGAFLKFLSLVFTSVVKSRLFLYQHRIMRNHHLGCLVIVVGNLTVGGTGKTPVVERLARNLRDRDRNVAILSRGYKSKKEPLHRKWWRLLTHKEADPPKIVSDGKKVLLGPHEAGDEPFMLAQNLPGVVVLVDKDRVKAGAYAVKKFGVDTLILDDGFQYLKLKDHLQLLLIDKSNPFGNGRLLPRGILREPISHMRRASYVFLTKSDGNPNPELEARIRRYKPDVELIECEHRPRYLKALQGEEQRPLESLKGDPVACFSAIAMPESFESFVEKFGADIVLRKRYLDHHWFSRRELDAVFREAREAGARYLVTTEKDAVRIDPDYALAMPCFYLRVEIGILSGVKDFEEAVSRICFPKRRMKTTRKPFAI